jgi:hypothetical protein
MRRARNEEAGVALVFAVFGVAVLGLVVASSLLVGSSDIRASRNYRGASQIHFVAESGITEAVQAINGFGIVNFQNEIANQWGTLYGTGTHSFGPFNGFTYSVSAAAAGADPANLGQLVATADGPEGVHNVVVANVRRTQIPSAGPGALYLANNQPTDATFQGDNFAVDGNDHMYTGGLASPNNPIPGLSTRTDQNTQEAINSLSDNQKDNIRGMGFQTGPPAVPSVLTAPNAPSISQMDQMINDILARGGVVNYADNQINGNNTFGGTGTNGEPPPQVTHFTSNDGVTIRGNGNASGAGIMIVEGDLTISGTLEFKGLILVRGRTNVQSDPSLTDVIGNGTIYGSLWTQDINLIVGGSALVYYSTQALALANQSQGGGALPSPVSVSSLADCTLIPAGTGGCP